MTEDPRPRRPPPAGDVVRATPKLKGEGDKQPQLTREREPEGKPE